MYQYRLKELRLRNRYTQQQVADVIGVTIHTYRRYETGESDLNSNCILPLMDLYCVSADYLLGRVDNPKPYSED